MRAKPTRPIHRPAIQLSPALAVEATKAKALLPPGLWFGINGSRKMNYLLPWPPAVTLRNFLSHSLPPPPLFFLDSKRVPSIVSWLHRKAAQHVAYAGPVAVTSACDSSWKRAWESDLETGQSRLFSEVFPTRSGMRYQGVRAKEQRASPVSCLVLFAHTHLQVQSTAD